MQHMIDQNVDENNLKDTTNRPGRWKYQTHDPSHIIMASKTPYQHVGVFFPYRRRPNEWRASGPGQPHIVSKDDGNDGFILCSKLGQAAMPPTICVVQSINTGELYVRKQLGNVLDAVPELPAEIRVSTCNHRHQGGDGYVVLSGKEDATYFNKLLMWQQQGGAYTAYFK